MVEGLVQLGVRVVPLVHGARVLHSEVFLGNQADATLHFTFDGRAESEAVYHQGKVRHRGIDVVVL